MRGSTPRTCSVTGSAEAKHSPETCQTSAPQVEHAGGEQRMPAPAWPTPRKQLPPLSCLCSSSHPPESACQAQHSDQLCALPLSSSRWEKSGSWGNMAVLHGYIPYFLLCPGVSCSLSLSYRILCLPFFDWGKLWRITQCLSRACALNTELRGLEQNLWFQLSPSCRKAPYLWARGICVCGWARLGATTK